MYHPLKPYVYDLFAFPNFDFVTEKCQNEALLSFVILTLFAVVFFYKYEIYKTALPNLPWQLGFQMTWKTWN